MHLEILQVADAPQYQKLRLLSFKEAPFAFSESFEDEKEKPLAAYEALLNAPGNPPEQFVLGVFEHKTLIGIATFKRDYRSKARHKGMIFAMYVHPDYRKQGVGKMLVTNIIYRASKMEGMEAIHLWVLHSEGHQSAAPFYQKLGFESVGIVKNDLKFDQKYIDAEYMVRYFR